ncbi:hypothetical protein GTY65_27685 [Streptomyces sp. SID8379]|uniref:hypothetical protein n=1 Tax=unclassified Streptomyces TaxID=2593676 RepID=UPI000475BCD3|nr:MULTISPECIES: hypothetical protein [unclassified Streptomyces]MYW67826.1 hypothetical protein [Streptomyces sp. SID8379]
MNADTHLIVHAARSAELQAEAEAHHLAATVADRHTPDLRTRLGWTLVEVGLRLASAPKPQRPLTA